MLLHASAGHPAQWRRSLERPGRGSRGAQPQALQGYFVLSLGLSWSCQQAAIGGEIACLSMKGTRRIKVLEAPQRRPLPGVSRAGGGRRGRLDICCVCNAELLEVQPHPSRLGLLARVVTAWWTARGASAEFWTNNGVAKRVRQARLNSPLRCHRSLQRH